MSKFDNDLKIGDLITTYHSGYWRVIGIEQRTHPKAGGYYGKDVDDQGNLLPAVIEYSSLIHYRLVMDSGFHPPKKKAKESCCDAGFCNKITKQMIVNLRDSELKKIKDGYDRLMQEVI